MPDETPEQALAPMTANVARTLVENHRAFLAFLERRVGSRAIAEDILQDAFIRGLGKLDTLRQNRSLISEPRGQADGGTEGGDRARLMHHRALDSDFVAIPRDAGPETREQQRRSHRERRDIERAVNHQGPGRIDLGIDN